MSEKVSFSREKETMLITLYGRALQSRSPDAILPDKWAEDAIRRIDYDFAKLKVGPRAAFLFASRGAQLDLWTREYLAEHPGATVLHLGCGMDSRAFRVAAPPGVRWFDVDYPDVIELRRRLYPQRPDYHTIGTSLADLDWLDAIPRDRPAMIVAEGVTMYLTEGVLKALLHALTGHFPEGWIAFDVHPRQLVRWLQRSNFNVRGTGATFQWGLGDARDITRLEPRLERVADVRATRHAAFARMPRKVRLAVRAMNVIPALRIMRCLLYRFARD